MWNFLMSDVRKVASYAKDMSVKKLQVLGWTGVFFSSLDVFLWQAKMQVHQGLRIVSLQYT